MNKAEFRALEVGHKVLANFGNQRKEAVVKQIHGMEALIAADGAKGAKLERWASYRSMSVVPPPSNEGPKSLSSLFRF